MVWDSQNTVLGDYDWKVLGHELGERATLPSKRLEIPMPYKVENLHNLAHSLAGLSEELHRIARLSANPRHAIGDAMRLIYQHKLSLQALKKDWETEYQELRKAAAENNHGRERLRSVG